MTSTKTGSTKPKLPRGRAAKKPLAAAKSNQATTEDMQREGLGVAAKE
ncbi:MAG: hypothetical protein ABIS38_06345 [Sphingomicrobium sp.]